MCYIDGQKNKYSVLNECNRMLKYNIYQPGSGSGEFPYDVRGEIVVLAYANEKQCPSHVKENTI
jgi:hypothetical protein